MLKEYVKPVMESEEFTANEYVAACWTITCNNSNKEAKCGGTEQVKAESMENISGLTLSGNSSSGIFKGDIEGITPGCTTISAYDLTNLLGILSYLWDLWVKGEVKEDDVFHPVTVTKGHTDENGWYYPNASV